MPHQVERGFDTVEDQHREGGGESQRDDDRHGRGRQTMRCRLRSSEVKMRGIMASTGSPISSSRLSRRRTVLSINSSIKINPAPKANPAATVIWKSLAG